MGRNISEEVIQQDIKAWPFRVVQDGPVKVEVSYKGERNRYFPEEISAAILEKMKKTAEAFLEMPVNDVVITCPAYFNNSQRQATKDAAIIAGLNVLRMINEPTAAAMAYGLNVNNVGRNNILIFDFGGGTFDVSIMTMKGQEFKVRAVTGDTHLGGEDIDQRMVNYFVNEFNRKYGRDISEDKSLMHNLKLHCERAKKMLSGTDVTTANFVLEGTNLAGNISRSCFEELNYELFEQSVNLVAIALNDAEMDKDDIDQVVLVGGSSRIPKIREMLFDIFGEKIRNQRINPDEAVALGAAIQAGLLQNQISDRLKGLKLCDVCPLSLGSRLHDGSFDVIIKRNTAIPTSASSTFYNAFDNQTSMIVEIYEGERTMAKDNHFLGQFILSDIPKTKRGETAIQDTYEIDANGILKVTAVVLASGTSKSLTITNASRANAIDVKKLADNAANFREEDALHQERLVALNAFEAQLFQMKRKINTLRSVARQKEAEAIRDTFLRWFEQNQMASKEEFFQKQCELEELWKRFQN